MATSNHITRVLSGAAAGFWTQRALLRALRFWREIALAGRLAGELARSGLARNGEAAAEAEVRILRLCVIVMFTSQAPPKPALLRQAGLKPASTCLWTGPRAQALLRGRASVAQFWASGREDLRLFARVINTISALSNP